MKVPLDQPIIKDGHFKWDEYCFLHGFGEYAEPTAQQYQNAVFLFTHLEPLRLELNRPMAIHSGARTDAYTKWLRERRGIPAALHSAHNDWQAVDIEVFGMRNIDLWLFCRKRWLGRMEQFASTPTWVHLDTRQWLGGVTFRP